MYRKYYLQSSTSNPVSPSHRLQRYHSSTLFLSITSLFIISQKQSKNKIQNHLFSPHLSQSATDFNIHHLSKENPLLHNVDQQTNKTLSSSCEKTSPSVVSTKYNQTVLPSPPIFPHILFSIPGKCECSSLNFVSYFQILSQNFDLRTDFHQGLVER